MKEEVKNVYVSGGGSLAADTLAVLGAETGKQVSFWDPMKNIKPSEAKDGPFIKEHSAEFAVALGMALRGLGPVRK